MKMKKLIWEDGDLQSSTKCFKDFCEYQISLNNRWMCKNPSPKITFKSVFDYDEKSIKNIDCNHIVFNPNYSDTECMELCKQECQKHFEKILLDYIK